MLSVSSLLNMDVSAWNILCTNLFELSLSMSKDENTREGKYLNAYLARLRMFDAKSATSCSFVECRKSTFEGTILPASIRSRSFEHDFKQSERDEEGFALMIKRSVFISPSIPKIPVLCERFCIIFRLYRIPRFRALPLRCTQNMLKYIHYYEF